MILTLEEAAAVGPVVACSGGFDPLHVGHLYYLQEAKGWAIHAGAQLLVIVNGDEYLRRKKGTVVMPWRDRAEIIDAIEWVDIVVGWWDGDTVDKALQALRPKAFLKGGDKGSAEEIPEHQTCRELGIELVVGIGGAKVRSSSDLQKYGRIA